MAEANDIAFTPSLIPTVSAPAWPKRCGTVIFLLFSSWLFPAKTAHRMAHLSLLKCWILHVVLSLGGALFIAAVVVAIEQSPLAVLREFENAWAEWKKYPYTTSAILLGIVLAVEVSHLALGFVVCAWGGVADERLRDSYRHALRQVWLRTPHAILIALLICTFATILDKAGDRWQTSHPEPSSTIWPNLPTPPIIAKTDPNYAAAQRQYQEEMRDFHEENRTWESWRRSRTWYLRNEEPLSVAIGFLGAGWWLAALLSAVGIRRNVAIVDRSPLCLWCGYDLSTMALESRCPECGQAVANSLGEDAQPGTAWEKRQQTGRASAWWHTWRSAAGDAGAFGRTLQLRTQRTDHRRFFALHLPMIFVIGAGGIVCGAAQDQGASVLTEDRSFTLLIATLFGMACMIGTTLVMCGTASLIGWVVSLQAKRNLLPASMQVAAYGTAYLVVWAIFGAVVLNCVMHLQMNGWYRIAQKFTGIHTDVLFFFSCFVSNLICGLIYLWLVARGTNGARYANR